MIVSQSYHCFNPDQNDAAQCFARLPRVETDRLGCTFSAKNDNRFFVSQPVRRYRETAHYSGNVAVFFYISANSQLLLNCGKYFTMKSIVLREKYAPLLA